ncbi:MAG TPA: hypothetical protein ENG87_04915 [Candidatus Pacearchaeota archaeon]|nr:hypothetical protein BMS3Abin17_00183 [archaeon BMS3Abin17]HDK42699.1 hypothetical protein [Candidatus Pacearchaeota archaeon]HDZ61303.1 hypothetical protein [Candidatus Pacearchaeota archaeon]
MEISFALKKIVQAAPTKDIKPAFADHPYFQYREEKKFKGVDTAMGVMGPGYHKRLKTYIQKIKDNNS